MRRIASTAALSVAILTSAAVHLQDPSGKSVAQRLDAVEKRLVDLERPRQATGIAPILYMEIADILSDDFDPALYMRGVEHSISKRSVSELQGQIMMWKGFQKHQVRQFAARLRSYPILAALSSAAEIDISTSGDVLDRNYHLARLITMVAYCEVADAIESPLLDEASKQELRDEFARMNADEIFDAGRSAWKEGRGDSLRRKMCPTWGKLKPK